MNRVSNFLLACGLICIASASTAQTSDNEQLKIAALEALISAPPERALPIVEKVLSSNDSDEIKSRALFVLSQIDMPEAQAALINVAHSNSGPLKIEAIRMIGITGNPEAIAGLSELYVSGVSEVKEAVLETYMIADDGDAIYQIAISTQDPEEFGNAVEMLGAMGAVERLRALRERGDMSEILIQAYAIAGDIESLQVLANDASNPESQVQAISAMGIAGGPEVGATLMKIYRDSDTPEVREAALEGMMIAGNDEGVLELFSASQDPDEKRELLELLVIMDSDAVWDVIDATLEN